MRLSRVASLPIAILTSSIRLLLRMLKKGISMPQFALSKRHSLFAELLRSPKSCMSTCASTWLRSNSIGLGATCRSEEVYRHHSVDLRRSYGVRGRDSRVRSQNDRAIGQRTDSRKPNSRQGRNGSSPETRQGDRDRRFER